MNMKKAIRLMALVLGILLFAGCSKTTMNIIFITGNWEHTKTETVKDGVHLDPYYPASHGMRIYFTFDDNGYFSRTETSTAFVGAEKTETGTWIVDGDLLFLNYIDGTEKYYIEKRGLLESILSQTYYKDGHEYIDYITLKK